MSSAPTYRALDYPLKIYGFWPGDLIAIALVFFAVHWVCDSLVLDIAIVVPALYLAHKTRKRPPLYISSLYTFAVTPRESGVGLEREMLNK